MSIVLMSFFTALALFVLMAKIDIEFFVKYQVITDIAVSAGLSLMFFGTFSGMVIALGAGLFISLFLFISKFFVYY